MAARTYTKAQKRTIRLSKKNGLSTKETMDKVNSLKSTHKTGRNVTLQAITAAFRRCDNESW